MIGSTDLILLDTNILVYAYDEQEGKKHERALALLDLAWLRKAHYALSIQNLSEFFIVATAKRGINAELIAQIVEDMGTFQNFTILNFDFGTVLNAIAIHRETKCHYYDSLIAATMLQHGVSQVYTEDTKSFEKIPGIQVTNPLT